MYDHWSCCFAATNFILLWCMVKHQDLVNLNISLSVFPVVSWAEMMAGTTEQSNSSRSFYRR